MSSSALGSALVTDPSSGIGAAYANRPVRRDRDRVQVARNKDRLETNTSQLRSKAGIAVEVVRRDLTVTEDLVRLETRLCQDASDGPSANDAGALVLKMASPIPAGAPHRVVASSNP